MLHNTHKGLIWLMLLGSLYITSGCGQEAASTVQSATLHGSHTRTQDDGEVSHKPRRFHYPRHTVLRQYFFANFRKAKYQPFSIKAGQHAAELEETEDQDEDGDIDRMFQGRIELKFVPIENIVYLRDADGHIIMTARKRLNSSLTIIDFFEGHALFRFGRPRDPANHPMVGRLEERLTPATVAGSSAYSEYAIKDASGRTIALSETQKKYTQSINIIDPYDHDRTLATLAVPVLENLVSLTTYWHIEFNDQDAVDSRMVLLIPAFRSFFPDDHAEKADLHNKKPAPKKSSSHH